MNRRRMIDVLWGARRAEPDPRTQENLARCALYTLHPARNVRLVPTKPPERKERPSA